jgi:putative PIN family toxin of toxin-antitoxin system
MFVVLDTNLIVSALCSTKGASFALIHSLPTPKFTPVLSPTLWAEYQDLIHRRDVIRASVSLTTRQTICDLVLTNAKLKRVHYRWRSQLQDPGDAHVLELAVAGQVEYIARTTSKTSARQRASVLQPSSLATSSNSSEDCHEHTYH